MNGLARWVPRLIIGTAVLHFVWAFAQPHAWGEIARDGFFMALADMNAPGYWPREGSVWFLACGVAMLAIGTLARHAVLTTGRLPAQVGWYLLVLGVPMCVLYYPVTGSWVLPVIGILGLVAARRGGRPQGGPAS
ncbi:DUF6463 family protein [Nonomuraea muscovyensis]|uniref:DUF3995 domain-containing protein n=1 Tax=Nonomuraea muscovyensis TaxID=1124761 RepID=A0A7X0BVB9_9ACTN|nr:DUF6463 family protein [Nonomuraea muscovyensis]MBB6343587.1 hypothetical protein [Nonomuraea muscovyensis]MDF2707476.1 hypothetical protein [Nonomuraea muscovyensis]